MYQEILTMEEELNKISKEKVKIASKMSCYVSDYSEEIEDKFNSLVQEGIEKNENFEDEWKNNQMRAEIKVDETQHYCICPLHKKSKLIDTTMIKCAGQNCQNHWYHLQCLNLTEKEIP